MNSLFLLLSEYLILLYFESFLLLLASEVLQAALELPSHIGKECALISDIVDISELILGDSELLEQSNDLQLYLEEYLFVFNLEQVL